MVPAKALSPLRSVGSLQKWALPPIYCIARYTAYWHEAARSSGGTGLKTGFSGGDGQSAEVWPVTCQALGLEVSSLESPSQACCPATDPVWGGRKAYRYR